jgi:hypothetical protein
LTADIGVEFFGERRRLGGREVREGRREEKSYATSDDPCTDWIHVHISNANSGTPRREKHTKGAPEAPSDED